MPEEQELAAQPQQDEWPDPVFTVSLIVANIAIFLLMVSRGVSFWTTNEYQALRWGADVAQLTLGQHQYWRLVTANFIHIGFVHLAFNMIVLFGLGRLAEYFFSATDFLLLYLYTGLCSGLLGVIWEPMATSAGASGAIFGISGVMLTTLLFADLPITKGSKEKVLSGVIQFTVLNLFIGGIQNYLPGIFHARIDNAGHIGGLVSGLVIGGVLCKHLGASDVDREYRRWAWAILFAAFLVLLALAVRHYQAMPLPAHLPVRNH
jgi:rhomboid protease GluP